MTEQTHTSNFCFKDCDLAAMATGEKAQNLQEMHDKLSTIHLGSVYFHFWGSRLRPNYEVQEYHNDFAMWAYHSLRDQTLAERLAIIDPTEYDDLEQVRNKVLTEIEIRLDETEHVPWTPKAKDFHFVRSKIIVFDTNYTISEPKELVQILPKMTHSSIFYHFIDAYRRTTQGFDDFSTWLQGFQDEYKDLIQKLQEIDFYFLSISELQTKLSDTFASYFSEKLGGQNK